MGRRNARCWSSQKSKGSKGNLEFSGLKGGKREREKVKPGLVPQQRERGTPSEGKRMQDVPFIYDMHTLS